MRSSVLMGALGLGALAVVYGCGAAKAQEHSVKAGETPEQFLAWSMDQYKAMTAFQAEAKMTMVSGGQPMALPQTRTIAYNAPNRFRLEATMPNDMKLTTVSNGDKLVEYTSRADIQAVSSPAPTSIADSGSSQMVMPMFNGTLLYQFFGGSANLANLVDRDKGPITYGDEESGDGEKARVVKFYATGKYGHAQALIGELTGRVYRLAYDSAPLLQFMKEQHGLNGLAMEAAEKRIAAMKPGPDRDKTQEVFNRAKDMAAPKTMASIETYSEIKTNGEVVSQSFDISLPKGMVAVEMPAAETDTPPVPVGNPAPDFEVKDMSGKGVKLSSLKGHVVMLDFWATWCPPCRKGLPETAEFAKRGAASGLQVLAISGESPGPIGDFLKQQPYKLPAFVDEGGAAGSAYKANAIPTVAIIDARGNLSAYFVGLQEKSTLEAALKKAGAQL